MVADTLGWSAIPALLIDIPEGHCVVAMELSLVGAHGRMELSCLVLLANRNSAIVAIYNVM